MLVATEKIFEKTEGYIDTVGNVESVLCFDGGDQYMHSFHRYGAGGEGGIQLCERCASDFFPSGLVLCCLSVCLSLCLCVCLCVRTGG